MRKKLLLAALSFTILSLSTLGQDRPARIVDLTYPFSETAIYWPTAEGFQKTTDFEGETDKGYYYSAYSFSGAEHGGTHLDAPVHFSEGMPANDEIPLERLIAPGVMIDLGDQVGDDSDYQIGPEDLQEWESDHGQIPSDHILLLRTGWGERYPNRKEYLGTDERGEEAVAKLHFPGLHPEAARWLVEERKILSVGIDTASIDYGQSTHFESHQVLFKAAIPVFENVAHLEQLPERGYELIALPMKIEGGSGGPLRIVAIFR